MILSFVLSGNKEIQPASAEEIARVIAETQRQLGVSINNDEPDEDLAPIHHTRRLSAESHDAQVTEIVQVKSDDLVYNTKHSTSSAKHYVDRSSILKQDTAYNSVDLDVKETKTQYYDFINKKVVNENEVHFDETNIVKHKDGKSDNTGSSNVTTEIPQNDAERSKSNNTDSTNGTTETVQNDAERSHIQVSRSGNTGSPIIVPPRQQHPEITEIQLPLLDADSTEAPLTPPPDIQANQTAERPHNHRRTDSVDSDKSKESAVSNDSSLSKEKIRIIPSEITKEKAAWFGGGGPPLETQRPKHLENDEKIKDVSETAISFKTSNERLDTVDRSVHSVSHNERSSDIIKVEGVYHTTAISSKEEVVYESQVIVTQTDTIESPAMSKPIQENPVNVSETDKETETERHSDAVATSTPLKIENEGPSDAVATSTPLKIENERHSDAVATSTPLKIVNSNVEKPVVSPLTVPTSAYPSQSRLPLQVAQHGSMVRDFSGSNISVADSTNEGRSRASSVSSISMLDLLQADSPKDSISMVAYDCIKQELEQCMKEKAQLEGQNEVLQVEATTAIKERAELQSQVAGLITQLKANEAMHKNVTEERNTLAVDLDLLKQKRGMLEQVIIDSHKLMEEKNLDLKTLQEDFQLSQEAKKKRDEKVKDLNQEMKAKEGTVAALKNKVAELYVDYQSTNQAKIYAENELKAAQSEITSLNHAKEWFERQIKSLQESNSGLQNELTKMQGQSIAQSTLIEKLKADNIRMRQHQTDLQQKALLDKELLAKQLESIEADILQRESMFVELQKEKDSLELELHSRPEHTASLSDLENTADDIRKLTNETKRKDAQINVMEREQKELVKRLTLSQESILERDKALDNLEKRYVEVETQLSKIQAEMLSKEEDQLALQEERNMMEVSLKAAKEEKKIIDKALQTVKADMTKVNHLILYFSGVENSLNHHLPCRTSGL